MKYRFVLSLLFNLCTFIDNAYAQDQFNVGNAVKTSAGIAITRTGNETECKRLTGDEICKILEWNGKPLLSQFYVTIDAAIPSKSNPLVIFATASTGGNGCCTDHYLIDLTNSEPVPIKVKSLPKPYEEDPVIKIFNGGFTYENYGDNRGPLGEPLWNVYRYKYGSNKLEVLRRIPKYSFTPLERKKYTNEILNDPINRNPILQVTGKEEFIIEVAIFNPNV